MQFRQMIRFTVFLFKYPAALSRGSGRGVVLPVLLLFTACVSFYGCGGGGGGGDVEKEWMVTMPAGFEVKNSQGIVQIDGNKSAVLLRQKGAVYSGGSVSADSAVSPIMCFRSSSATTIRKTADKTWQFWSEGGSAVEWYLFDVASNGTAPESGAGLLVFDGSGKVVYDSSKPPMSVVWQGQTPSGEWRQSNQTWRDMGYLYLNQQLPSGRKHAVCLSTISYANFNGHVKDAAYFDAQERLKIKYMGVSWPFDMVNSTAFYQTVFKKGTAVLVIDVTDF